MSPARCSDRDEGPGALCVIAEGQLGDLLILSPALRAIRESFPRATVTLLALQRRSYESAGERPSGVLRESPRGGTCRLLAADPHVDHVAEIDREALRGLRGLRRLRAEASVVRWLRRKRFDAVICTFPQDRFYLWARASGARDRVGEAGRPLSRLLTRRIARTRRSGGVLDYYCALAEAAGARVVSRRTHVSLREEDRVRASERWTAAGLPESGPVVAVHPGASGLYRIWPPRSYAGLIDRIQERGIPVVLFGSAFDAGVVEAVRARCGKAPHVIMTADVLELAALLERCALCISNNSGPRHLAVAAGVSSLAIIPRFDDAEWKIYDDDVRAGTLQSSEACPACPPGVCANTIPPGEQSGSYCMRALDVGTVDARVRELLASTRIA